jgi:MipA family protein
LKGAKYIPYGFLNFERLFMLSVEATPSPRPNLTTLQFMLATSLLFSASAAFSQSPDKKAAGPWQVSAGLAAVSTPEYEGASKTVTGLAPDVNVSYKTDGYGSFAFGSKARGFSWTAMDTEAYSLGLSLGVGARRNDSKDGTLFSPGSKRLKGMGEIKYSAEYGVFGHVKAGVPLTFALIKGSGNGTANATDGSFNGHGGTRLELGASIPWQVNSNLGLSFSPNLVWADSKYNQTYFGVTGAQSAKSGFAAYTAKSGVKSIGLTVGADYKIDNNWSANAALSLNQLRGDAAKSPLVQSKAQNTFVVGVSYLF